MFGAKDGARRQPSDGAVRILIRRSGAGADARNPIGVGRGLAAADRGQHQTCRQSGSGAASLGEALVA